jgi:phage terminase small subunit
MSKELTPRQRKFVNAYLLCGNATKAAIKAGYSKKTAYSIGQRLLKNVEVQKAIAAGQGEAQKEFTITRDEVLRDLARMKSFDPRKLFRADGTVKPIHELDDDTAWCLSQLENSISTVDSASGDATIMHDNCKRKWESKMAALKQICEMCGYNAPVELGKNTITALIRMASKNA